MIRMAAENRKSPQNLICGDFFYCDVYVADY